MHPQTVLNFVKADFSRRFDNNIFLQDIVNDWAIWMDDYNIRDVDLSHYIFKDMIIKLDERLEIKDYQIYRVGRN